MSNDHQGETFVTQHNIKLGIRPHCVMEGRLQESRKCSYKPSQTNAFPPAPTVASFEPKPARFAVHVCSIYWVSGTFQGGASFVDHFLLFIFQCCLYHCHVCSLQPCDHLLGKGWSLGSLVCDFLLCFCHVWCLGSVVVLTCFNSLSFLVNVSIKRST